VNEKSSSIQGIPASSEVLLSIRLWVTASDTPSELVWKSKAAAASVAMDLVEVSGGTGVTAKGNLLVSSFPNVPMAILAARRIQWAVSGCADAGDITGGSAAILIQSAEGHSSQASLPSPSLSLEHASPGQILLVEASCKSLDHLPGLALLPASAGLRELQWRTSGSTPNHLQDDQSDDQILGQLMRQHGLEDPAAAEPDESVKLVPKPVPVTAPVRAVAPGKNLAAQVPVETSIQPFYEIWLSRLHAMPLWHKVASGAVLLAIAVTLLLVFSRGKAQVHAPGQSQVQPTAVLPSPQPQQKPATTTTTKPALPKVLDAHAKPHPAPLEPRLTGACVLNASDISSELSIADARFQNRQYKEAERRYRSVLACQPENGHALSGAERARGALQLQPSFTNP
jgi:hypothetical protein